MSRNSSFEELVRRLHQGDALAASEIVRNYETAVRVAVRLRLLDQRLRQHFDSMDICQSVLASFFLRAATGQYELHEPAQLVALLTQMVRNKLAIHVRSEYRERRDIRRNIAMPRDLVETTGSSAQKFVNRDLIQHAFKLMEPPIKSIAELRVLGCEWTEIAARLGGTAEARRKQFRRAMDGIANTLDIE